MMAKHFEVGDLVWAKMKGFSHWPGEISAPKSSTVKKYHHFVYFYGSDNYAWIPDENIELHNETLADKYARSQKRSQIYLKAVDKILLASKGISKYLKTFQVSYDDNNSSYSKESSVSRKRKTSLEKYSKKLSPDFPMKLSSKKKKKNDHSELLDSQTANYSFSHGGFGYSDDNDVDSSPGILSRNKYKERPKSPPIDLTSKSLALKDIYPTYKKIGFLGLGRMGQTMVRNLLLTGHSVTVWDPLPEKYNKFVQPDNSQEGTFPAAELAQTPADLITACDITFCCVSDPDISRNLVFENCGVLRGFQSLVSSVEKKGFVQMTSLDPQTSITIGLEINRKGGRYLEAQIDGSRSDVSEGRLHILAAGDQSLYDDCHSCFSAFSENHSFVGPELGTASKYNIIHNMLNGAVYAALAECLALVHRVGLDQADFVKILEYGELNNPVVLEKAQSMIKNDYICETPLKHIQTNINFAMKLGNSVELPLPIIGASNEIYKHCKLLRYGDHDVSAVYEGTRR